jgi:hypothetical protein
MTMPSARPIVPMRKATGWLVVVTVLFVAGIFALIAAAALKFANESLWNPLARMRADDIVKSLPAKLGVVRVELITVVGSCGGAILTLSDQVSKQIEADGVALLGKDWHQTPVPRNWYGEGDLGMALHCMDLSRELEKLLVRATLEPRNYFASGERGAIVVLPRERLVLVTFYD